MPALTDRSKLLGEVTQALLLLSLKSKAEGPTCYSSADDLLATERKIEHWTGLASPSLEKEAQGLASQPFPKSNGSRKKGN